MMNLSCQVILILCQILKIVSKYHKKYEIITAIPPVQAYINRNNSRLVFKIKGGYKLELKMFETMKMFGSTKKLINKTKKEKTYQVLK